jgi:tripartite ATP-independent transporter DctP family solute receptor
VHERTEGRIQIRIYANAELGSEEDLIGQLTYGGCDFMRASVATLTEYNPEANVLMMPYLYDSKEQMWKVLLGEIGDELMDSFEGTGIVPLNRYDAGVRSFYFSEPVRSVGDLAGKRIRVQDSALMQDFIRAIGGEPVTTVFDDVYEALETRRVAGAENNWSSYESMGHYEVAPYYVLDGHTRIPELVLMSGVTMEKLSGEDAAIIRECARSSTDYERELWEKREEESRDLVIASGTEVIRFSDWEIGKLRESVMPLYEQYCGEYMDLVERIRAT